jgi:hypothetical protein
MGARTLPLVLAVSLGSLPSPAHAQYIPPWVVVGALSPVLVILLAAILGLLVKSVRIGALHAALVLLWIVLFSVASYFVENDSVIWTPLVLYLLHFVLLGILIAVQIAKRIAAKGHTR